MIMNSDPDSIGGGRQPAGATVGVLWYSDLSPRPPFLRGKGERGG